MRTGGSTMSNWGVSLSVAVSLLFPGAVLADSPWGAGYFPNVKLVNQDGVERRFYDDVLKGKAVAVNLIYTHCTGTCPLETARMAQVQKLLGDRVGKDIFFYSISIDPQRDTPQTLKAYMARYHIGPGWEFLTGSDEAIRLVAKKLGLSSLTDAGNRDGHLPNLMVGNEATGQWMQNSAVDNPRFLAATIANFFGWKAAQPAHNYADLRTPPAVNKGLYLFNTRCAACHTIGRGDRLGPDLVDVPARRERSWAARFLAAPDRMLAEGDPVAVGLFEKYRNVRMPNLNLDDEEVSALLDYIVAQSRQVRSDSVKVAPGRTMSAATVPARR
ncbi:MAG TPA: SCO family protein [Gemmatimonadales bacterium]